MMNAVATPEVDMLSSIPTPPMVVNITTLESRLTPRSETAMITASLAMLVDFGR